MRPPISSARYAAVSTTSLWLNPTSEIRLIVMVSADRAALGAVPAAIVDAPRKIPAHETSSFVSTRIPREKFSAAS